jgi:2,3,4,5-tetrahydropyridine-2-carboxylate N-succinyltransferase
MNNADLAAQIEAAWERRAELSPQTKGADVEAIEAALDLLDSGQARVATRGGDGVWTTHQWLKKAVLLSFRISSNQLIGAHADDPSPGPWWDKVPSKFHGWSAATFEKAGFRAVPGAIVRRGAHIGKGAVLMPSFVNLGANVGENAMIDTWASIGSCAQIGKGVHISAGAGIGGVLEPVQANPTIIEDECFIGARSEVVEGVIVREGSVLAMGVFITRSTKIVDRATGAVTQGEVPPYSVVVPGSLPDPKGGPSLACAVIVKRVDAQTRAKTGVNELLRD